MFRTILNSYNMLKKLLLASCTLLFLLEASSTSNIRKLEVVRISKVCKPPFVKIFRRKRLSRTIPYYHNSISARRIILSGDIELTPGPENPKKYPKVNFKERQAKLQRAEIAIKLYKLTRNACHVYIVKMKHIFDAAIHITLRSQTREILLYGRAASVNLENYHSLLSEISKMSTKALIYHHHSR